MHHSAEIGQRELALTDGFAAATARVLQRLRGMVLPTDTSRPMLPDSALANGVFQDACAEFIQPLVGDTWWSQHGLAYVGGILPGIMDNLQTVLTQAAADPSISVEQERAAALAMLHLSGGALPSLTAAGPPGDTPQWSVKWTKAWNAWHLAAGIDDDQAVARGYQRVGEALQDAAAHTVDSAVKQALLNKARQQLDLAAQTNPAAAKISGALQKFTNAVAGLTSVHSFPFPGPPSSPYSSAVQGQKNYYTQSQRKARTATVSSYNQDALDRARQTQAEAGVRHAKTWLATADARTRDDHEDADGQQVGLDEAFIVGDAELSYPGDPDGPDEQVINCRCTFTTDEADDSGSGDTETGLAAAMLSPLTAAQEATSMTLPIGWTGVLAPLDTVSGDGRQIATPPALRIRQAPVPFFWQKESDDEHGGSVLIGRIDKAWIADGNLMGTGTFDMENPDAQEYARQLGAGFASRVSVDLDDVTVDFQSDESDGTVDDDDILFMPEGTLVCVDWRLSGATGVGVSAFDEAIITAVFDTAAAPAASGASALMSPVASGADASGHAIVFAVDGEVAIGDIVSLDDPDNPGTTVQGTVTEIDGVGSPDDTTVTISLPSEDGSADARFVTVPLTDVTLVTALDDDASDGTEGAALVASGFPLTPPREWFTNPAYGIGKQDSRLQPLLGQPGAYAAPLTIDDRGRISGHLAAWGTCHTGLPGCTTPPTSRSGYAAFMLGETVLADGGRIATGTLTFDTGHADISLDARSAIRHYDHTGTAFGTVVIGEDIHGIWVAGAMLPDVKPETMPRIRASKLSGDWRGGELRAALAVNSPGFPTMRARSNDLDHAPLALVASGVVQFVPQTKPVNPRLVKAVARELERMGRRRAQADELGRRVNNIKVQQLVARISTKEK